MVQKIYQQGAESVFEIWVCMSVNHKARKHRVQTGLNLRSGHNVFHMLIELMTCVCYSLSTCIPSSTQSTKSLIAPPCRDWFIARAILRYLCLFLCFLCVANVPLWGAAYLICSAFSCRLILLLKVISIVWNQSSPHLMTKV